MGLVYDPNEMRQLSDHLKENVNKGKEILNQIKSANEKLNSSTGSGTNLDSNSIDKWKEKVLEKTFEIENVVKYLDETEKGIKRLDNVIIHAGEEHLDEDNINESIIANQHLLNGVQNTINLIVSNNSNHMTSNKITDAYASSLKNHKDSEFIYQSRIDELNKKLEKLHKINSEVGSVFNSSNKVLEATNSNNNEFELMAKQLGITKNEFMKVYNTILSNIGHNKFGAKNFINLLKMMNQGNLTEESFLKYGAHGQKTINYLMHDWRVIKKALRNINNPASEKILKLMKGSFNQLLNNLNKLKDYKGVSKFINPLNKYVGWATDFKKKGTITAIQKFAGVASKAPWLKSVCKLSVVGGWATMGLSVGYDTVTDFNKEKGDYFQKAGKAVIHAGINQLKSAGPLEGALIGAQFGPVGAGVGFIAGGFNAIAGAVSPQFKEAFFNGIENTSKSVVDLADNTVKNVGNVVHNAWNGMTSWFKGGINSYGQ